MLSNMVRLHPELLSVSEFFTSLTSRAFRGRRPAGETVFRRLNTLSPGGRALLTNGLFVDELLYPLGPGARYGAGETPARIDSRGSAIGRVVDDAETSPYPIIMRTTVTIDDDVYEAALCHARATGRRLGQVLSDMARRSMTPEPPPKRTRGHRFPAFDVPAGARIIASSRIQAALDEDGVV